MATSRQVEDTEITLTTSKVLALFFALSAVCAVFFAIGFLFGKNSVRQTETAAASQSGVAIRTETPKPPAGPSAAPPLAIPADTTPVASATTKPDAPTPGDSVTPTPEADASIPRPTNGYYVQVAAVSKQEDADALIDALKKKQYPAFLPAAATDNLFHVQIGPFAEIKDAEAVRSRLLSDGYNPIIKR
jgi:cell division septation protein DedD